MVKIIYGSVLNIYMESIYSIQRLIQVGTWTLQIPNLSSRECNWEELILKLNSNTGIVDLNMFRTFSEKSDLKKGTKLLNYYKKKKKRKKREQAMELEDGGEEIATAWVHNK